MINKIIPVLILLFFLSCNSVVEKKIQTYEVQQGTFRISVIESGELKATQSTMLSAPSLSWRFGNLKITRLIEDGSDVQQGDTLILFDQSEVQKSIIDATAELDIAKAEYEKLKTNQQSKIEDLEADLRMAEISFEIAKIELEQSLYEAEIKKKEIQLQLNQAEISLTKARTEITDQKKINFEELQKQKLKIKQLKSNLKDAYESLSKLTITAPTPGIVIIEENWTSKSKWQVGDQPWSGWPIISLPDLSEIKAKTEINELDIAKIKLDQKVRITLDAYPDTTFTGKIISIATLAREKDHKSKVKVFPVEILIDGVDELLMPGMTVSCEIIVDEIENVLFIPLEALFSKNGKNIVYVADGAKYKIREVENGLENNDYVIIKKGLKKGEVIALDDPTKILIKGELRK